MSKTNIGIKTAFSVVLIALIQGLLSFYRISVILNAYGDKINGIVQVALQISAYLILFQSGMAAAYQYKMYAPLSEGNDSRVSSLFSGLQRSMLKVSGKMLLVAVVVIPAYSALLLNQGVEYLDTLFILGVIGVRITVPYFFTLPERCLIDIKEKKYIIIAVEGVKDCLTLCTEILLIKFTAIPLPLVLSVNFVYLGITKIFYLRLIRKFYGKSFSLKSLPEYASSTMSKAVYAHQISTMATSNTDNVVLSILSSLKNVTIYSAYATLVAYPTVVISRIIEGMRASLALKITRNDDNSYLAFREMMAFALLCVCTIVPVFLQLANPFVSLWIGTQYSVPFFPLLMFGLILANNFIMPVIYAARDARGLYRESRNFTIVQAVVNVVVSVSLVIPFGIIGVLSGTIAALYLILLPYNINLVYAKVFGRRAAAYIDLLAAAGICAASYFVSGLVLNYLPQSDGGWMAFFRDAAVCTAIAGVFAFAGLWVSNNGFRMLVRRFLRRHGTIAKNVDSGA